MPEHDTDRNLLSGIIALQCDLIDMQQFVDACTLWSSRKDSTLPEVLVQQGWLQEGDRAHVEYLVSRRIQKHAGNTRQSIATVPPEIKAALESIGDAAIRNSIASEKDQRSTVTMQWTPQSQRGDRFSLRSLHSSGGIGQVWIAYDHVLDREVAPKELKLDQASSARSRERFIREAQLTGQLEHPGVVPVYEFQSGEGGDRSFYTMRYIKGRTLTEVMREERRDTDETGISGEMIRLLNAFVGICQTIAYAHSKYVIHRDLKGDNIILGDFGEVIVLDWRLAKRVGDHESISQVATDSEQTIVHTNDSQHDSSATLQGEKLGTPAYMAPEQALGNIDEIDTRTDVYGLAAILYEILTGVPPFQGKSIVETLHLVIHVPPKTPREFYSDIPRELEAICLQGLSKHRHQRQPSAAILAEQVENWIAERAERKRTEQERERFFNLSQDLLATVDSRGAFKQANTAWETVLGWPHWELMSKNLRDILHPDEHLRLADSLGKILAGESLNSVERRCLCKDGTHRWIHWNANLIKGEAAVYLVGRDITVRKRSEETFQELLESAPDGMVIINEKGQIVLVNAQLERMFGYQRKELLGQPVEILVPDEHREQHPTYVARYLASPETRPMASGLNLHGRRKDGQIFTAEISLSPVRTEQGILVSAAVRDGTMRKPREVR